MKTIAIAVPGLIITILLVACGVRQITDIPPVVQLQQMRIGSGHVRLALRIDNANDIAVSGSQLSFRMQLEGKPFARYDGNPDLRIIANSAEVVPVRVVPDDGALRRLRRLVDQRRRGLRWSMGGELKLDQSLESSFATHGRCFTVPGEPAVLRCTSSVKEGPESHESVRQQLPGG